MSIALQSSSNYTIMPKTSNRPQRSGAAKCSDHVLQLPDMVASSRREPRSVMAAPPPSFPPQQLKQHLSRQKQRCTNYSTSGVDDLHQHLQPMRWSKKESGATESRSRRACGSTLQRGAESQHHQAAPHPHQQMPSQQMLSRQSKQQQQQQQQRRLRPCETVAAGDMEMPDDSDEFDDLVDIARDDCSLPMGGGQHQQQAQPEYTDYDDDEANSAGGDGIWEEAEEDDDNEEDDFDEDGVDDEEEEEVSDDVTDSAGNGNYSQQMYHQQQLMQQKQLHQQQQQQQVLRGSCNGVDCRGDDGLAATMHHRPATYSKLADVRRMSQQQQLQQMQQQQAKKHMQQQQHHQPRLAQFDQRARVHSSPAAGSKIVDPSEGKPTGRQQKQQQQAVQERQPQQQKAQQLPPLVPPPPFHQYQQQQQQPHHVMPASQAQQLQPPCHTSNSSNDYQQRITGRLILEMVSCGRCNVCRLASFSHGTSFSATDASGMKQPVAQVIRIAQPGCCSRQALPGTTAASVNGDSSCSATAVNAAASTASTATSRRTRRCLNQQLQPE